MVAVVYFLVQVYSKCYSQLEGCHLVDFQHDFIYNHLMCTQHVWWPVLCHCRAAGPELFASWIATT